MSISDLNIQLCAQPLCEAIEEAGLVRISNHDISMLGYRDFWPAADQPNWLGAFHHEPRLDKKFVRCARHNKRRPYFTTISRSREIRAWSLKGLSLKGDGHD